MNRSTRAPCRTRRAVSRASGACSNHTWHDAAVLRVLITGITGFAGSHLAEHLVSRGDEVHRLAHERPPFANLAAGEGRVRIHEGDITRPAGVGGAPAGARAGPIARPARTAASHPPLALPR